MGKRKMSLPQHCEGLDALGNLAAPKNPAAQNRTIRANSDQNLVRTRVKHVEEPSWVHSVSEGVALRSLLADRTNVSSCGSVHRWTSGMSWKKFVPCFIIMIAIVMPLAHAQTVDCPHSRIAVTIDGKWESGEWDDGAEIPLTAASSFKPGAGFARIKYDSLYFYAVLDFISVSTASGADGAGVQFDTNNNGGNTTDADDYRFKSDYKGAGSMAQGNGSGFGPYLPLPDGALVGASIGSSPYSSDSHPIYEFRVPLSMFPIVSTARLALGVWQGTNAPNLVLMVWPKDFLRDVPSTWGIINFPTSVPEFTSATAVAVLALLVATCVTRIQIQTMKKASLRRH
jgi:hypothetical protein